MEWHLGQARPSSASVERLCLASASACEDLPYVFKAALAAAAHRSGVAAPCRFAPGAATPAARHQRTRRSPWRRRTSTHRGDPAATASLPTALAQPDGLVR